MKPKYMTEKTTLFKCFDVVENTRLLFYSRENNLDTKVFNMLQTVSLF